MDAKELPGMVRDALASASEAQRDAFWEAYGARRRKLWAAYLWSILPGANRVYLGESFGWAVLVFFLTGVTFGVWWLVEVVRMPKMTRSANRERAIQTMTELRTINGGGGGARFEPVPAP